MRISRRHLALWISSATAGSSRTFASASLSSSRSSESSLAFVRNYQHSSVDRPLVGRSSTGRTPRTRRTSSKTLTQRSMSTQASSSSPHRVALCQFPVSGDKLENQKVAESYIRRASEAGSQLVVLPEIWNGPYATAAFADYAEELPNVGADSTSTHNSPSTRLLQDLARELNLWIVGGSISEREENELYNTCLVMNPEGTIVAKHRKVHLFDIDVPGGITFFESDTLSAGNTMSHFDTGDDLFGMVGLGICYDIRFPEYALLLNQKYQCNLLIYPGAFNLTTGPAHWELLQRARAVDNQCYVMMASPARTPEPDTPSKYPHYTAWGHSTIVSPWGDIVATCDEKEALVIADLDLNKVTEMRQGIPTGKQKRTDLYTLQAVNKDE